MPEFDESGAMLPGTRSVHVDVSGLDAFATSVETELGANFEPQSARLMKVYEQGSHFGVGHASSDVAAARHRYTECLQAAVDQLAGYVSATQVLVEAARTVAARYRDTDAFAASNLLEAKAALDQAVTAADTARRAAEAPTQQPPFEGGVRYE